MPPGARIKVAWTYDAGLHAQLNACGRNYWHRYCEEILNRLGVNADSLPPALLADEERLSGYRVLIAGGMDCTSFDPAAASVLMDWISGGGTLIGFACGGLNEVFGIEGGDWWRQSPDEFSICAYLELTETPVTQGIHSDLHPDQPLIAVSPVRLVMPRGAETIARLLRPAPDDPGRGRAALPTGFAAITGRDVGAGHAFYFAFDVAQTMWAVHQGRPVEADFDGDGYLRAMDARIIEQNQREVGYSDELHFLLQNMIGRQPVPMIHQIPPADGEVADALISFGGDDEGTPEYQVTASDFMRSRGLPYHINCMPVEGRFALSADEIRHIEGNGHELSLHYDFMAGFDHPTGFTREDVRRQSALFKEVFGRPAVCSVNHWVRWVGWCEPARWMAEEGQLGDNSWMGLISPPVNPVNSIDLSFGTAFPRRVWDDWRNGNERIDFVEEHIGAYEVGYLQDETDPARIHEAVDLALRYRLTLGFFYHPIYLATFPACRAAVDELLRYLAERKATCVFMGSDELARWWLARAEATVEDVREVDGRVCFRATCNYQGGFVVKVCTGETPAVSAIVNGECAPVRIAREFGAHWAFIALPPGAHDVVLAAATCEDGGLG
ncbi:MAG: hypothetical protein HPY44_08735 [Armatimonadetes bacterium]|nr:hypothetical protein [Armatimonadota bacterium]